MTVVGHSSNLWFKIKPAAVWKTDYGQEWGYCGRKMNKQEKYIRRRSNNRAQVTYNNGQGGAEKLVIPVEPTEFINGLDAGGERKKQVHPNNLISKLSFTINLL